MTLEEDEEPVPAWAEKAPELQRIDNDIEELELQPELGEPSFCVRGPGLSEHARTLQGVTRDILGDPSQMPSKYALRRAMEWTGIDLNIVNTSLKDGYVSYEIAIYSGEKNWTVF